MALEKRKFIRLKLKEPYFIRVRLYQANKLVNFSLKRDAYSLNISTTGMYIVLFNLTPVEIRELKEADCRLIIEFKTPYLKKPVKLLGRIAWAERKEKSGESIYSAGVYFEGLKEKDREKVLQNMLDLCLKSKGSI